MNESHKCHMWGQKLRPRKVKDLACKDSPLDFTAFISHVIEATFTSFGFDQFFFGPVVYSKHQKVENNCTIVLLFLKILDQ